MSFSLEALDTFAQLLASVNLNAMDPDLEAKAAKVARVRAELADAVAEAKGKP